MVFFSRLRGVGPVRLSESVFVNSLGGPRESGGMADAPDLGTGVAGSSALPQII